MDGFLDTCILIDLMRRNPIALEWAKNQHLKFGIARLVQFEILEGLLGENAPAEQEKTQFLRAIQFLAGYPVYDSTQEIGELAIENYARYKRSFRAISPHDFLIAATAQYHQIPLYSRNEKHMGAILPTKLLIVPYQVR